jgi:hypothetical protein
MTTTVKRITISLTKEQERQLKALMKITGENQSQVIHAAIRQLYWFYNSYPKVEAPDNPPQS